MAHNLFVPEHLLWDVDLIGNIGSATGSALLRPLNIYMGGYIEIKEIATPSVANSGTNRLYFNSTDHLLHYINSSSVDSAIGVTSFPLLAPAGTVTAPSYAIGSTNTGIYQPATHQIGFTTNGIQAGYFDASQNLNIIENLNLTNVNTINWGTGAISASLNYNGGGLFRSTITNSAPNYSWRWSIGGGSDVAELQSNSGTAFFYIAAGITPGTANTYDIGNYGGAGANITTWRSIYFGTSVIGPLYQGTDIASGTSTTVAATIVRGGNQTVASGTANGGALTVQAGNATGSGSTGNGGTLVLAGGTTIGGAAGQVQFQTAGIQAAYFDASQNLNLTESLIINQFSATKYLGASTAYATVGIDASGILQTLMQNNVNTSFRWGVGATNIATLQSNSGTVFLYIGGTINTLNGSASVPAYGFDLSSGLGMYSSGTNLLDFATNSVDRWRIDASGNLLAVADGSYNIGANGTNRPNNAYIKVGLFSATANLLGSTSGTFTEQANTTTTSYTVTWPAAQGGASTFLQNDGSGNLSWTSGGGGITGPGTTVVGNIVTWNSTTGAVVQDPGIHLINSGTNNLLIGAQGGLSSSNGNTILNASGMNSGAGGNCVVIGVGAYGLTNSVVIGNSANSNTGNGIRSVFIGYQVVSSTGGNDSVCIGNLSGSSSGNAATCIGSYSGPAAGSSANIIALGYKAGAYDNIAGSLYIDAFDRTNTAGGKTGAIIYGSMNSTAASQLLTFNAATTVAYTLTMSASSAANILWTTDGGGNIGTLSGNRPAQISAKNYVTVGGTATGQRTSVMQRNGGSMAVLGFWPDYNGADVFGFAYRDGGTTGLMELVGFSPYTTMFSWNTSTGAYTMNATSGANILWGTDGGGNIGASGANRAANIYVSTAAYINGLVLSNPNSTSLSLAGIVGSGSMGIHTVSIGLLSGSNAPGADNTFVGYSAGSAYGASSTGNENTAFGSQALAGSANSLATGNFNVAIGYEVMRAITSGAGNVGVGYQALALLTTGSNNTACGFAAGNSFGSGTGNVFLGNYAGSNPGTVSNSFYLGNIAQSNAANDIAYSLLYGQFSGTAGSLTGQQLTINGTLNTNGNFSFAASTNSISWSGASANNFIDANYAGADRLRISGHQEIAFQVDGTLNILAYGTGVQIGGALTTTTDATWDFGIDVPNSASAVRFRDGYLSRNLFLGGTAGGSTTSSSIIYFGSNTSSVAYISAPSSGRLTLNGALEVNFQIGGTFMAGFYNPASPVSPEMYYQCHITNISDNSYDIGHSPNDGIGRFRDCWLGRDLYLGGTSGGSTTSTSHIYFGSTTGSTAYLTANAHAFNGVTSGTLTLQPAATTTSYTVTWPAAQGAANSYLQNDGSGNLSWAASSFTPTVPTVQVFLSSSGTYTRPAGVLYIRVRMIGGGGGGAGSGTVSAGNGGNGGNTTFGTSLLVANGGAGNNSGAAAGGTASLGSGPVGIALTGAAGEDYETSGTATPGSGIGGMGGSTPFGGGGAGGGNATSAGRAAATNTGAGGGGAGIGRVTTANSGGGGGAGGFVDAIITSPASTYSYAVGTSGSGGTAGTSGDVGGAGGSGLIIVEEFYQ